MFGLHKYLQLLEYQAIHQLTLFQNIYLFIEFDKEV